MTPYVYGNELDVPRLQADLATGQVPPLVALAVLTWLYGPGAVPRENAAATARDIAILNIEEAARACDAGRSALGALSDTINDIHKELTR